MLETKNLEYRVNRNFFLSDINFSVPKGYMTCLVGKNGSGKTTLMNLLYGCVMPTWGSVYFEGNEIIRRDKKSQHLRRMTGYHRDVAYIGSRQWCVEKMSPDDNTAFLRCMYDSFDIKEYERIMEIFGFERSDRKVRYSSLSSGQKMQFQIAFHMARHPKLYLMDEPLANLDPVIKEDILELVRRKISVENATVLMSTHLVEETGDMTDYIGIMSDGMMMAFGNKEEIFERYGTDSIRELIKEDGKWTAGKFPG